MIRKLALPALSIVAALLLAGCVDDYRVRRGPGGGEYYYGQPSTEYRYYGSPYGGWGPYGGYYPYGESYRFRSYYNYGYPYRYGGYPYYGGYPGYGYPRYGGYPYYPRYRHSRPPVTNPNPGVVPRRPPSMGGNLPAVPGMRPSPSMPSQPPMSRPSPVQSMPQPHYRNREFREVER